MDLSKYIELTVFCTVESKPRSSRTLNLEKPTLMRIRCLRRDVRISSIKASLSRETRTFTPSTQGSLDTVRFLPRHNLEWDKILWGTPEGAYPLARAIEYSLSDDLMASACSTLEVGENIKTRRPAGAGLGIYSISVS